MKKDMFKGKLGHRRLLSVILPIAFVLIFLFQLWFAGFAEKKQLFVDLTSEGLYTLTDKMVKECEYLPTLEKELKITFCADPDVLRGSVRTRVVYFMCLALQKVYPSLKIETVNLKTNPTAVNAYKTTSLSEIVSTDVIVSYGQSFRIISADAFWTSGETEDEIFSYNGEYKMATLFHSLTSRNSPVAYFITNHGETYYDPENPDRPGNKDAYSLYQLLLERGLNVKTLDLSKVSDIPADCALLVINNPTSDYGYDASKGDQYAYISETEMLNRYLVREQGSLMIAVDYKKNAELKNLKEFLFEWGFELGDKQLTDKDASLAATNKDGSPDYSNLVGQYITEENTYAYAIYGAYASLPSSPRFVVSDAGEVKCAYDLGTGTPEPGSNTTSRYYAPFFSTTAAGTLRDEEGNAASIAGVRDICAIGLRHGVDSETLAYSYSYVFCANSASFFSEQTLGNPSFANFDVTSALVENISREDVYASMDLGGASLNSSSYGGKRLQKEAIATAITEIHGSDGSVVKTNLPITAGAKALVITVALVIPFGVAAAGIFIHLRRRFR